MKTKLLSLAVMLLQFYTTLYAQCNKAILKTPDEYVENRLTGNDKIYGHPYTMFNKRLSNFNIDAELAYIRTQIQY